MRINELYKENEYKSFVEFCEECSIMQVEDLKRVDFVLFQKLYHCSDSLKFELMNLQDIYNKNSLTKKIEQSDNLIVYENKKLYDVVDNDNDVESIHRFYNELRQKELQDESNYITLFGEKIFLEDDDDGFFADNIRLIELAQAMPIKQLERIESISVVESVEKKEREYFSMVLDIKEKCYKIEFNVIKFDITKIVADLLDSCLYLKNCLIIHDDWCSGDNEKFDFQNLEENIFIEHLNFENGVSELRKYMVKPLIVEKDISCHLSFFFYGFNEDLVCELYSIFQSCFLDVMEKANAYFSIDRLNNSLLPVIIDKADAQICHLVLDKDKRDVEEICKVNSLTYLKDLLKVGIWVGHFSTAYRLEQATLKSIKLLFNPKESFIKCLQPLKPRNDAILRQRYFNNLKCKTLEEVGKKYGVTRERIRQIDDQTYRIMSSKSNNERINGLIKSIMCFSKSKYYTTFEEFNSFGINIGFITFLENLLGNKIFLENAEILVFRDYEWVEKIEQFAEKIPETIQISSVDYYVSDVIKILNEIGYDIDYKTVEEIIFKLYSKNGEIYCKTKLSLLQKYKIVLEKYFSDGINVYDDFEMDKFRSCYKKTFADDAVSENNRALVGRIVDNCLVIARGRYGLKKERYISDELMTKLYFYIKNYSRDIIMTNTIFNEFEESLLQEGVGNKYYLQAIIRQQYENEFFFTRDYISRSKEKSTIYSDIIAYIANRQEVVNLDEMKSEFYGVPDIVFAMALNDKDIIGLWNKNYVHSSVLDISEEDVDFLRDMIDELVSTNLIIDSNKLFQKIYEQNKKFINKNNIDNQFMMYSIVKFIFDGEYEFKRPFIAELGKVIDGGKERILAYIEQFDEIEISAVQEYSEEQGIHIYSIFELINGLDDYIRVDVKNLKKMAHVNIDAENIESIKDTLSFLFDNNGYISSEIIDYYLLPIINLEWNRWLLQSIVTRHIKEVTTLYTTNFFNNAIPIFVDAKLEIDNYEDFLIYAIKKENNIERFKTLQELKQWLMEKGLNLKGIPQFIFTRNIIEINENDRITIY